MMRVCLFIVVSVLGFSCSRQTTLTAVLTPRTLKAVNLEETVSRRDELMMAYSLTSYDAQNKPVGVVNGGWGVESAQKGQQVDLRAAQPISLALPKNGKIVASLVLIEVDDYNQAKQMLDQIRQVHNVVSGPAAFLVTATEILTPLKYVTAGLAASGIGLKLADQFDDDDLLGQSSVELNEAEMRQKKQRFVRVPAVFTGQNLRDAFEYQLEYDVTLNVMKIQPTRQ
ncbi:hypothetical protein ACFSUS_20305 [Spirosoma soli]|uniref:DUF3313 domain-containing protein n=1 Tax=Spirosoma soli TaxID=1770529 RepID=A0ABW5M9B5_9BACT